MTLFGTFTNGMIVLENGTQLPEGTRVEVVVPTPEAQAPTLRERLLKLAGTVDDLPSDMARNHDHYIHGSPKR